MLIAGGGGTERNGTPTLTAGARASRVRQSGARTGIASLPTMASEANQFEMMTRALMLAENSVHGEAEAAFHQAKESPDILVPRSGASTSNRSESEPSSARLPCVRAVTTHRGSSV